MRGREAALSDAVPDPRTAYRSYGECLHLLVIGVVKGGTSNLVRVLRDSYQGVLHGPIGGPWHSNSEGMWCTPHCPGHSGWGVFGLPPTEGWNGKDTCEVCGLRESQGLTQYGEYREACSRPDCWSEMLVEHFGSATAGFGRRLLAKNPDALFWPHLASAYLARSVRCGTKILAMLRNPVDRTLSHFGWYYRKTRAPPDSSAIAFEHWWNLSLAAHSSSLHRFLDSSSQEEHVQSWKDLVYSLESEAQRSRWAAR